MGVMPSGENEILLLGGAYSHLQGRRMLFHLSLSFSSASVSIAITPNAVVYTNR